MKKIIFFVIYFSFFVGFSQIQFSTNVRSTVYENDFFQLSFILSFEGNPEIKSFSPPDFDKSFDVNKRPQISSSSNSSISIINGKRTITKENLEKYTYNLRVRKSGEYIIPSASIVVDGKVYRTKQKKIKVLKNNSEESTSNESIYLSVFSNKKNVFVGEPLKLTYKLYFKNQISNPQIVDFPSYSNFFKEEKEKKELTVKSEEYRGEVFKSVILKEVILIPQLAGKHLIEKLKINLIEQIPIKRKTTFNDPFFNDPFSSFFHQTNNINREISCRRISIIVNDLPEEGRPEDFSGAVGEYTLDFSLDKDTVSVGETVLLNMVLSGYGNLDFFDLPILNLEKNDFLSVYEPELSEKSSIYRNRTIKGEKKQKYIIVPTQPGFFEIPEYQFSYFDTKEKIYKNITISSRKVFVLGNGEENSEEDFEEIMSEEIRDKNNQAFQFKTIVKYFLFCISVIFLIWFVVLVKKHMMLRFKRRKLETAETAKKSIKNAFYSVSKKGKDPQLFKNELLKALYLYFSRKFNLPQSIFSKENLKQELSNKNISNDLINETMNIFHQLEMLNYSGIENLKISESIFKESIDLINRFENN